MSRRAIDEHRLDKIEAALHDRPAALARQFEEWAADPHPDDWLNVAELLARAAERWLSIGDREAAIQAARRAVEHGGHVPPDARCYLLDCLLDAGRHDEADAVASDLRRSRPDTFDAFVFVGESYEVCNRPKEAHRWFTMGLSRAERMGGSERAYRELLAARYRVRRAMELPTDELDLAHRGAMLEELKADGYDIEDMLANARKGLTSSLGAFRR